MTHQHVFNTERTAHVFDESEPLQIQLWISNEPGEDRTLNGFEQERQQIDSYIVFYLDKHDAHNYQFPIDTTLDDITFDQDGFCRICLDHGPADTTSFRVWFRRSSRDENVQVCRDCAVELLSYRNQCIDEFGQEKFLSYSI